MRCQRGGDQLADGLTGWAEADELMLLVKEPTTKVNHRSMDLIAQAWELDPDNIAGDPTTWQRH